MQWSANGFVVDDDRQRLDLERIVAWLGESYWAGSQPPEVIRRSWEAAGITLGLFKDEDGEMIGCARAVTDFARFAYLSDVYVDPAYRGQGLGRWLVQLMIEHPEVPRVRWVLHTNDAHGLYQQFGFEAADETVMQRPKPS